MATTFVVSDELDAILEKMCVSGVRHPIDLTKVFLGTPIKLLFSMGDDEETPTVSLSSDGTHHWPSFSDPTFSFDDRTVS